MTDTKLSALPAISQADVDDTVIIYCVDADAGNVSSQISRGNLFAGTKKTNLNITFPSGPTGSAGTAFVGGMNQASNTITFATTAQSANYYTNYFGQATLVNPSSGIIGTAATIYIAGAPIASTYVTIANNYALYVAAGTTVLQATTVAGTLTMSSANIALGSNEITTTDLIFSEITNINNSLLGQPKSLQIQGSSTNYSQLAMVPGTSSLTAASAALLFFANNDVVTNPSMMAIGRNLQSTSEFAVAMLNQGSGVPYALNFYMQAASGGTTTKLLTLTTGNIIQAQVPLNIGTSLSTNNQIWTASQGSSTTTLYIGNASITTVSDIRIKTDINTWKGNALDMISKMRVVDFAWNDPSDKAEINKNSRGKYVGFIAQEVIDIMPWTVNAPDRHCSDCKLGRQCKKHRNFWQLEYEYIVPILCKGMQELQQKVELLEKRDSTS